MAVLDEHRELMASHLSTPSNIHDMKLLSQLSDRLHFMQHHDGSWFAFFSGLVVPYGLARHLCMSVLLSSRASADRDWHAWTDAVCLMNQEDREIQGLGNRSEKLLAHLAMRLRTAMQTWDTGEYEEVLDVFLDEDALVQPIG